MDEEKIAMLINLDPVQLRAALEKLTTEELRSVALAVAHKLHKK